MQMNCIISSTLFQLFALCLLQPHSNSVFIKFNYIINYLDYEYTTLK